MESSAQNEPTSKIVIGSQIGSRMTDVSGEEGLSKKKKKRKKSRDMLHSMVTTGGRQG